MTADHYKRALAILEVMLEAKCPAALAEVRGSCATLAMKQPHGVYRDALLEIANGDVRQIVQRARTSNQKENEGGSGRAH